MSDKEAIEKIQAAADKAKPPELSIDEQWEAYEARIAAHWKRLEGKEPGPRTYIGRTLLVVRSQKNPLTSDVSIALQLHTDKALERLLVLQKRKLVARQAPLYMGPGSWESRWQPLETDSWPTKRA